MTGETIQNSLYTIKRGDTLTKIAKAHNTTPQELARINYLSNIDIIKVGQQLIVRPGIPAEPDHKEAIDDMTGHLFLKFVDAVEKPIAKMKVWVKAGAEEIEHLTDFRGEIPSVQINKPDTPVTVQVKKAAGGKKTISTFTTDSGQNTSVLLTSPKIGVNATQKLKEGKSQLPQKPQNDKQLEPGDVVNKNTSDGPLQIIACECPNKDNLRLGLNNKYRDILLAASARTGFSAQAIAALLDAEAGRITNIFQMPVLKKDGSPVIDQKTKMPKTWPRKDSTEWDPKSKNPKGNATGLTQFLDSSWIDMALREGSFLNQRVKEEGWLTTTKIEIIKTKKVKNAKTKKLEIVKEKSEKTMPAFALSDGTFAIPRKGMGLAQTLACKPYKTGHRTASDKNLQELLDLRCNPEYAIHTAVDYAKDNIKALKNAGYPVDSLNDGEQAKIMYLCHHLGGGDAPLFINNTMTAEHAKYLLQMQMPVEKAEAKAKTEGGDWLKAHRNWLGGFIDEKIQLKNHMCDTSAAKEVRDLLAITEAIKRR